MRRVDTAEVGADDRRRMLLARVFTRKEQPPIPLRGGGRGGERRGEEGRGGGRRGEEGRGGERRGEGGRREERRGQERR